MQGTEPLNHGNMEAEAVLLWYQGLARKETCPTTCPKHLRNTMFLDVFETWGFRDFNNDSPVHVNEMMQDQKPVILPHGFLYYLFFAFTCTSVSALSARCSWLFFQKRLGWPLRRLSGNSRSRKTNSSTFFFLERRFYAPISGEIEPVLEDRSGTDFLPETGCFFRYDYFDGFSGRRMFVPDVF